jgi:hypothetical protein
MRAYCCSLHSAISVGLSVILFSVEYSGPPLTLTLTLTQPALFSVQYSTVAHLGSRPQCNPNPNPTFGFVHSVSAPAQLAPSFAERLLQIHATSRTAFEDRITPLIRTQSTAY